MVDDAVAAVAGYEGLIEVGIPVGIVVGVGPREVVACVAGRLVGQLVVGVLVGIHLRENVDAYVRVLDVHLCLGHVRVKIAIDGLEGVDGASTVESYRPVVGTALVSSAVALVVVVDLCTLHVAADGDDGLAVLLFHREGGQRGLHLQVDELLGNTAQQIAVALGNSLHSELLVEGEGLGVAGARGGGLAAVECVEYLCARHGALQRDDGAEVLIFQLDGWCRSLRDGGLRGCQQRQCATQHGGRLCVGERLLRVGYVDVAVVTDVVGVDGYEFVVLIGSGQHGIVGKQAAESHALDGHLVAEDDDVGGFLGIGVFNQINVTEE